MSSTKRVLCGYGIDVDAVAGWINTCDGSRPNPSEVSRGIYGATVGLDRVLSLLAKYSIKATFFVPAHTVESFPAQMAKLTAAQQRDVLSRSVDLLTAFCGGTRPRGYTAPAWLASVELVGQLQEFGVQYDHSFMHHDFQMYMVPDPAWRSWARHMEMSLLAWRDMIVTQTSNGPEWFDLAVNHALLRLHRPCPRNPDPGPASLVQCFAAAHSVASGYWENVYGGSLKYPWHAAHQGWEAAVVVLWALRRGGSGNGSLIRERCGIAKVLETVHLYSSLFLLLGERWPRARACYEAYERLKTRVLGDIFRPWGTRDRDRGGDDGTGGTRDELDDLVLPPTSTCFGQTAPNNTTGEEDSRGRTIPHPGIDTAIDGSKSSPAGAAACQGSISPKCVGNNPSADLASESSPLDWETAAHPQQQELEILDLFSLDWTSLQDGDFVEPHWAF